MEKPKKTPIQSDYGSRPNTISNAYTLFREAQSEKSNLSMKEIVLTCLDVDRALEKILRRRLNSW
jgi:hypothetical protein